MAGTVEQVRLLIPDNEQIFGDAENEYLFATEEIEGYLEIAGGSALRAAAFAMIAIANSEAMISKVIKTQDLTTDGAKVSEAMLKNAAMLLRRADDQEKLDNVFYMEIVGYDPEWSSSQPELTEWNWNP